MTTPKTTIERIDKLSTERTHLYRIGRKSRRGKGDLKRRVAQITAELEQLWDLRRRERIGRPDGIDLLVERSYTEIYGDDYRDAVTPIVVEDERDQVALVA